MNNRYREFIRRYTEVVITNGVALYPGQKLNIITGYKNYEFACELAECAYQAGASYVAIDAVSNILARKRVEHSSQENLSYVPEYIPLKYAQMCADDWTFIRIDDTEELEVLAGLPVDELSIVEKGTRNSKKLYYKNLFGNKITWCVICAPGPEWARHILGNAEVEPLLSLLEPILRLDQEDPVDAWRQHGENLLERRRTLDGMDIESLRFISDNTDLRVYLNKTSEWHGGPSQTIDGRNFTANIPTEEVFTTPNFMKTEGTVAVTRPLKVLETLVEGAQLTFRAGRVVEYTATKGADVLKEYFELDDGASALGEVALVGADSPLAQSGRLYGSILYDENASCHIALGSGYPSCLSNMQKLRGDAQLQDAGCNISLVHTDFMIGSDTIKVLAIDRGGREHVLMEEGYFVL